MKKNGKILKMSDKYYQWKERTEKHEIDHNKEKTNDKSCSQCYLSVTTDKKFIRFWKWYRKEIPEVENYSAKTEEFFYEYLDEGQDFDTRKWKQNNRANSIKGKITKILSSMRYRERPQITEREIGELLIEITVASNKFEKSMKRTEELWTEYTNLTSEPDTDSDESPEENENDKENWYQIFVGNKGPYEIRGNGIGYEVIFQDEDKDELNYEEFKTECKIRGMDENELQEILDEISNWIQRKEFIPQTNFEDFENNINTPSERPSSAVSTTSETEEENLSGNTTETEDNEQMAAQGTYHLDCGKFSGGVDEDVEQWISEVDRVAIALGITDPDNDICPRLNYAAVHLTGTAAKWFEANKTAMNISRWGTGNNDRQLKVRLRTAFLTQERQDRWQDEMYETKQKSGESVENYAQRFRRNARRAGIQLQKEEKQSHLQMDYYQFTKH